MEQTYTFPPHITHWLFTLAVPNLEVYVINSSSTHCANFAWLIAVNRAACEFNDLTVGTLTTERQTHRSQIVS